MNRIITKHELWNLPYEQITEFTKGQFVRIVLNTGEHIDDFVVRLLLAANPPNSFVGFMTSHKGNFYIREIEHVEVLL